MQQVDSAIIEFANDAFYLAFNTRDMDQMSDLWATDHPCVCIHPGWAPIFGREDILLSWESIFDGQSADSKILCHEPRVFVQSDIYSVVCYEQLPGGWLIATNNFVLEGGIARMVHHQAGQCMEPPELVAKNETLQ